MDSTQKRYYWIKLKDSFITSDAVDFLMAQPNGAEYVVLYQMLCLKTVNTNGELARQIGEIIIPYDIEKIQRDTKFFKLDTIRVALELYKRLGLVYEQENGILKITDFSNLVGGEVSSAKRVREHRERKRLKQEQERELLALHCNGESNTRVTQEKEIRDKRIDIRDKDIYLKDNICSNQKKSQKETQVKRFVPPTLSEVEAYCKERNSNVNAKVFFDYFTEGGWCDSKGNKVRNWKQKLITWEKHQQTDTKQEPACEYDFSKYQI